MSTEVTKQEQLMKAVKGLQMTASKRGVVVVGKGEQVISFPFSYYTKLDEQNNFKVHEKAGEQSFSRFNMLLAVTEIVVGLEPEVTEIEGITLVAHNFVPVFVPDIVAAQIEQSKYWSQKFKAMQAYESALAQIEKRAPRNLNFILDGKKKITAEELMLWEALREELGKRPYISLRGLKTARDFFKKDEVRSRMTGAAVAKAWAKLQEMGATIANFTNEGQFSEQTDAGFESAEEALYYESLAESEEENDLLVSE